MSVFLSQYMYILIVLPVFVGILAYFLPKKLGIIVCIAAQAVHLTYSIFAFFNAKQTPLELAVGGWRAPIGIMLYLDNLSAVMVVLVSFLFLMLLLFQYRAPLRGQSVFNAFFDIRRAYGGDIFMRRLIYHICNGGGIHHRRIASYNEQTRLALHVRRHDIPAGKYIRDDVLSIRARIFI